MNKLTLTEHAKFMSAALIAIKRLERKIKEQEKVALNSFPHLPKQGAGFCGAMGYHMKMNKIKDFLKYYDSELANLYRLKKSAESEYNKHKSQILQNANLGHRNTCDLETIVKQSFH